MAAKVPLSLAEIAALEGVTFLVPLQVSKVLSCSPYTINVAARDEKGRERLGFPVSLMGTRVKIPRIPFLHFMGWDGPIA